MKKTYLSLLILVCTQASQAQLLNTQAVLGQLNTVTRQVESTAEQIKRKAEQDVEKLKPGVDKLTNTTGKLVEPLLKLPQQLPILNNAGQTAFVEVEVENGFRAIQREWLVTIDTSDIASLQQLPIDIVETTRFDELDLTLIRFRVPAELDSLAALKKLLPEKLAAGLDRNHIYSPQADTAQAFVNTTTQTSACNEPVKIGMIDTALKLDHPAFKNATNAKHIIAQNFLEAQLSEPDAHGTAVAGLLVGSGEQLIPLLPNASLYIASVFYTRNDYAQGASMMNLVRALNWLMAENVSVINMSLAGPDNQILAKVIAKTIANGKAIVAAVGNEGPAAPPMFPAAYPNVIGVTAIDHEQKIYRWANRGNQVIFAALGVSVFTARSSGGYGRESGTSMAAPVVSALLSCALYQKPGLNNAVTTLANGAIDLGDKGKDVVFGFGWVK